LVKLSDIIEKAYAAMDKLNAEIEKAHGKGDPHQAARAFADSVTPAMTELRTYCDQLEAVVPDDLWPLPKYREMLFVR
jgi:glutamine synthetase